VTEAARLLDVRPGDCVFLGDAVSDIIPGRAARAVVLGYDKTARRGEELARAGSLLMPRA
jgi:beta-phosphoglucomutase-like phosphatase (HAD superfamily)